MQGRVSEDLSQCAHGITHSAFDRATFCTISALLREVKHFIATLRTGHTNKCNYISSCQEPLSLTAQAKLVKNFSVIQLSSSCQTMKDTKLPLSKLCVLHPINQADLWSGKPAGIMSILWIHNVLKLPLCEVSPWFVWEPNSAESTAASCCLSCISIIFG